MTLWAFSDAECLELAERHGTPLFAYSGARAEAAFRSLREALPSRVKIAYAVKANPLPALLGRFAELGAGFDCASAGELERVRDLGLGPGRVCFGGPAMRTGELALALRLGARIQAHGLEDLERIEALAEGETSVNLRIHPAFDIQEETQIIGGGAGPSAFGVDEEDVAELLEAASRLRRVRIRGLQVFVASNQRSAPKLLQIHAATLDLARRIQGLLPEALEQIDLGGGLGVPYAEGEPPLDLSRFGCSMGELLQQNPWFKGELVLEPGRFLAAPCGVYLARVLREKRSRGRRFAILEGGINHLLRPLLAGQPFPVRAIGKSGPETPTMLAGPLCTGLDRLGEVQLPQMATGDLVAFGMAGAYGFTESMTRFLSHPEAPEVWVP